MKNILRYVAENEGCSSFSLYDGIKNDITTAVWWDEVRQGRLVATKRLVCGIECGHFLYSKEYAEENGIANEFKVPTATMKGLNWG